MEYPGLHMGHLIRVYIIIQPIKYIKKAKLIQESMVDDVARGYWVTARKHRGR